MREKRVCLGADGGCRWLLGGRAVVCGGMGVGLGGGMLQGERVKFGRLESRCVEDRAAKFTWLLSGINEP